MERNKRNKPSFPDVDLTKPVNKKQVMSTIGEEDCFSREWNPEDKLCSMCADMEICGILFHAQQNKKVKQLETEEGGFLDTVAFDQINKKALFKWLSESPRTTKEFLDHVQKIAKCPDVKTVVYWIKSYIISHPKLATKKGIVIIKP